MGRAILIFALGSMLMFSIINMNMSKTVLDASSDAFNQYEGIVARNIANSVAEILLLRLADSTTLRYTSTKNIASILSGSATYRIYDTTISSVSMVKIPVTATYMGVSKSVIVLARTIGPGFIPPAVKAAISTNNNVSTLGTLIVNGQNHDINGNLIPNSGTLGIWTTQGIDQSGNSTIGGTSGGVDIAPYKNAGSNVAAINQVYPGGYPTNPDSVLGGVAKGCPPGTLKAIAQSGVNGSQYTTNPASLSHPLRGVTYVELADGASWSPADITGDGILIVHNSAINANINNVNWGPFKGLLIADDLSHFHSNLNLLGAIVVLSPNPSEGNSIGNGSGDVLYSSQAIMNAVGATLNSQNSGYAKHRLTVTGWFE